MSVADDRDLRALRIRAARPGDSPRVAALLHALDTLHAEIQPRFFRRPPAGEPATARARRKILDEKTARLFVAEHEEEIIGVISAQLYDTPDAPEMAPRRRVNIESLVVAPSHRRRGVGRTLLAAAEAWARSRGAAQVVLTVWSGNDEADRFYRAIGYAPSSQVLCRELG